MGFDFSIHSISDAEDASAQFFSKFGMTLSPAITALPDSETPGRAVISPERMGLLEADLPLTMDDALALGFPSVLSIPYGLANVLPKIVAAASKA